MNYKFYKRLKDAGYPQNGQDSCPENMSVAEAIKAGEVATAPELQDLMDLLHKYSLTIHATHHESNLWEASVHIPSEYLLPTLDVQICCDEDIQVIKHGDDLVEILSEIYIATKEIERRMLEYGLYDEKNK